MIFSCTSTECTIQVEKHAFSEAVLYKCFYWYSGKYQVQIMEKDTENWLIKLKGKDNAVIGKEALLENKISQDLIDFKLREIVTQETKVIRELLVAKAFSHYDNKQNPATEISDPVGFNPESVINEPSSKNC